MAGDEMAPWESGSGRRAADPTKPASGIEKPYKLPRLDDLPAIYKPDDAGFLAHGGTTVNRPGPEPRQLDPKGKLALMVLGAAVGLGLIGLLLSFVMIAPEAGPIRFVYAGLTGAVALAAGLVLLAEFPRINAARMGSFMPGVLVYGTKDQFTRAAGPVGVGTIQSVTAQGSGRGLLSAVFDRAAHAASPPEMVALHCDRGSGPELVGIAWEAVHEMRRGDIVWFRMLKPNQFLMYHKLIPFAPRVNTDQATREEVFRALRVGQSMLREAASTKNMGKTKVFHTDADGKLTSGSAAAVKPDPNLPAPNLLAAGQSFATEDQIDQAAPGMHEAPPARQRRPGFDTKGNVKLSDPGKPLGGYAQDQGSDDKGYVGDA
ncbi:MAG: hypothetical protein IPP14_13310 [Planctomycetes bacterium]|nr:hypothetical protein [Planctomycetota bacterium]